MAPSPPLTSTSSWQMQKERESYQSGIYGPDLRVVLITSAEGGQECNGAAGLEGTGK